MNKFARTTITVIGTILCTIVIILNLFFVATISNSLAEQVDVKLLNTFEIIFTVLVVIALYKIISKIRKTPRTHKQKVQILITILIIYLLLQIVWISLRNALPIFDQQNVYEAAVAIYENKLDTIMQSQYFELYPQQITLANFYALIFKLVGHASPLICQFLNAIANCFTILGILLITKMLGKKYEVSYAKALGISLAFITLPLLSTFVYGDFISLPMCLFAIYFIMKYAEKNQIIYLIASALLMALAYITRMNSLIFIIALTIYLILDILSKKQNATIVLKKILLTMLFVAISLLPATALKSFWQTKLKLEKNNTFPVTGYICMSMQEGERQNGWYNGSASLAFENVNMAKQQYKTDIANRIKTFIQDPAYFIKFYVVKTASMWTENTYAGLWYNQSYNFGQIAGMEPTIFNQLFGLALDLIVKHLIVPLYIFQKAVILIIFGSTLITIIKNKDDLSNEVLLLVTIFIGGFLFHTIWEAKSRYIIPYIVALMPMVSLEIEDYIHNAYTKIRNVKLKKIDKITSKKT